MHCISLVISGPAGVGKTTICDRLVREFEASLKRVITSTTRRPRNSEKHGIDYYFLSNQQFEDLKEKKILSLSMPKFMETITVQQKNL